MNKYLNDFNLDNEFEELDELDELDDISNSDLQNLEITEITDVYGQTYQYFNLGSVIYNNKAYAFFTPAEEIDGLDDDYVLVCEVNENSNEILPVNDELLIDELLKEFSYTFEGEFINEDNLN